MHSNLIKIGPWGSGKVFYKSSTFFHFRLKSRTPLGKCFISLLTMQICSVSKLSWNLSSVFGDIDINMIISTNADDNYVNDTKWHMTHKMSFRKVYLLKSATWSKNTQKKWIVCKHNKEQQGKLVHLSLWMHWMGSTTGWI